MKAGHGRAPVLSLSNLSVTIDVESGEPVRALQDVTLTVAQGERLAVVGSSGSGKSMLARALFDILPTTARVTGDITVDGTPLRTLAPSARRRVNGAKLGMVFQDPLASLSPQESVGAHVVEVLLTHTALTRSSARARAEELLARVSSRESPIVFSRLPSELSGGERQRAALAIALAAEPLVVVADEPTAALDAVTTARVLAVLEEERARTGAALLLITHDLALVRDRCERVVVLCEGRVVEDGPVARVLSSPEHSATRALVDAASPSRQRGPDGEPLFGAARNSRAAGADAGPRP